MCPQKRFFREGVRKSGLISLTQENGLWIPRRPAGQFERKDGFEVFRTRLSRRLKFSGFSAAYEQAAIHVRHKEIEG